MAWTGRTPDLTTGFNHPDGKKAAAPIPPIAPRIILSAWRRETCFDDMVTPPLEFILLFNFGLL